MNRWWVDKRPIQFIHSFTDVENHKNALVSQKYEGAEELLRGPGHSFLITSRT